MTKTPLTLRPTHARDADRVWEIHQAVIATGDTFAFDETTQREDALHYWMNPAQINRVVEIDGVVAGMFSVRNNQPGRGSHIGNGSFMVHPDFHGRGVGKTMGKAAIEAARAHGYHGIQYNYVISTNEAAVTLWQSLGFRILARTPGGFRHATLGYVDSLILFLDLRESATTTQPNGASV